MGIGRYGGRGSDKAGARDSNSPAARPFHYKGADIVSAQGGKLSFSFNGKEHSANTLEEAMRLIDNLVKNKKDPLSSKQRKGISGIF